MISQSLTISTTSRLTGRIPRGTSRHRAVVHIPVWRRDMVIIQAAPRHMQRSRLTDTPRMSIQRVTFPLQARVFLTFHRFTFTITHHPGPLRWPRFLLTTTLTRRCIPTDTPPTHLNPPRMGHLRVRVGQTISQVLPSGEMSVAITGGRCSRRGLQRHLSYPLLVIKFVSEEDPLLFTQRPRYILILRLAPGRLRPPKPLRPSLVLLRTCLHNLLTVIPFRLCRRRSFPLLTRLGRIKALHRPLPLPREAQKITTRQVLSFREARMGVERVAGTSKRLYTTRIRCCIPAYHITLRALMRCYRSRNPKRDRRGHRCTH